MFTTLVAVIAALVLGHVASTRVAALRRFQWYRGWLEWLGMQSGDGGFWAGRYGLALAVLPPVLLMAVAQWLLARPLLGLLGLLLGVVVLACTWGPRDLDVDIEAALDADGAEARRARLALLATEPGQDVREGPGLPAAVMRAALRRWFAVLWWFLLLGPAGALLYRLVEQAVAGVGHGLLPEDNAAGARRLLHLLDWPVAQLMTLSLALVGNFDLVFRAWRAAAGDRWTGRTDFLDAAARTAVSGELEEEAQDYVREGYLPLRPDLPELRDAMSLVWRMLLLWLAILALLVIAGWVT